MSRRKRTSRYRWPPDFCYAVLIPCFVGEIAKQFHQFDSVHIRIRRVVVPEHRIQVVERQGCNMMLSGVFQQRVLPCTIASTEKSRFSLGIRHSTTSGVKLCEIPAQHTLVWVMCLTVGINRNTQ